VVEEAKPSCQGGCLSNSTIGIGKVQAELDKYYKVEEYRKARRTSLRHRLLGALNFSENMLETGSSG